MRLNDYFYSGQEERVYKLMAVKKGFYVLARIFFTSCRTASQVLKVTLKKEWIFHITSHILVTQKFVKEYFYFG